MKPRPFQLEPRHRAWFYSLFSLLFASGFAAWLVGQALEGDAASRSAWAEAARPWILKIHGAAVFAFLIMLGTILALHVRRTWPSRRNHRSGLILIAWIGLQIVTGYGLYYFGGEKLRAWTLTLHESLGLLAPIALAVHILVGRWLVRRSAP